MFNKNLTKAVLNDKNDAREYLKYVFFNAQRLEHCATNGHIMLIESANVQNINNKNCLLNPITGEICDSVDVERFPDYQRLYVDNGDSVDQDGKPYKIYKFTGKKRNGRALKLIEIDGVYFNYEYFKTIIEFFNGESINITCNNTGCYQFLNADKSKRALLMKIRVDNDDIFNNNYTYLKTISNIDELKGKEKKETFVYLVGDDILTLKVFKTRAMAEKFANGGEIKICPVYD